MENIEKCERSTEMTIFEFAEGLNGREYGNEITPFEEQRAKELGFVVVFGYSDDNAEFRGAYDEEIGCYDGGRVYEDADKYIDAVWCDGEYSWTYKTNIPHATFDIYEDGEKYRSVSWHSCGRAFEDKEAHCQAEHHSSFGRDWMGRRFMRTYIGLSRLAITDIRKQYARRLLVLS